jgi:hypothetical protein
MQRGGVGLGIVGGGSVDGRSVGPVTPVGPGAGVEVSGGTLSVEVTPGKAGAGALPELLPVPPLQRRYR